MIRVLVLIAIKRVFKCYDPLILYLIVLYLFVTLFGFETCNFGPFFNFFGFWHLFRHVNQDRTKYDINKKELWKTSPALASTVATPLGIEKFDSNVFHLLNLTKAFLIWLHTYTLSLSLLSLYHGWRLHSGQVLEIWNNCFNPFS